MTDDLYTNSTDFLRVVIEMKSLPPFYHSLALHAADYWTMEDLRRRIDVSVPWNGPTPPVPEPETPEQSKPNLRIVQ
jgi:hypothetical protein